MVGWVIAWPSCRLCLDGAVWIVEYWSIGLTLQYVRVHIFERGTNPLIPPTPLPNPPRQFNCALVAGYGVGFMIFVGGGTVIFTGVSGSNNLGANAFFGSGCVRAWLWVGCRCLCVYVCVGGEGRGGF